MLHAANSAFCSSSLLLLYCYVSDLLVCCCIIVPYAYFFYCCRCFLNGLLSSAKCVFYVVPFLTLFLVDVPTFSAHSGFVFSPFIAHVSRSLMHFLGHSPFQVEKKAYLFKDFREKFLQWIGLLSQIISISPLL